MIKTFIKRLKAIGIEVELVTNFPWVYIVKINGKAVKETYWSEHAFCIGFIPIRRGQKEVLHETTALFKLIRKYR